MVGTYLFWRIQSKHFSHFCNSCFSLAWPPGRRWVIIICLWLFPVCEKFLTSLSLQWCQCNWAFMNKNISNLSYLYIGIALTLATCISWVAGLSDNRSGHSSISLGVVTPHATKLKISCTMFCLGIATITKVIYTIRDDISSLHPQVSTTQETLHWFNHH